MPPKFILNNILIKIKLNYYKFIINLQKLDSGFHLRKRPFFISDENLKYAL